MVTQPQLQQLQSLLKSLLKPLLWQREVIRGGILEGERLLLNKIFSQDAAATLAPTVAAVAARRKRDDAAASETPAAPATPEVAVAAGKDKSSPMMPK